MEIQGLQALYAGHKSVKALAKALQDGSARTIFAEGLCASAAPLLFSSVAAACPQVMACPYVFVLDDAEEAGYFYHMTACFSEYSRKVLDKAKSRQPTIPEQMKQAEQQLAKEEPPKEHIKEVAHDR